MQLEWTAALLDASKQRHVIGAEFLQPYHSRCDNQTTPCARLMTCLACMTDTACAWCLASHTHSAAAAAAAAGSAG